jgi:hypothetical protein
LRVLRAALILALGAAAFQASAPLPSAQNAPAPVYQEDIYKGIISCSPSPDSEYCSNVADKFYTVTLNGRDYVLKPGPRTTQAISWLVWRTFRSFFKTCQGFCLQTKVTTPENKALPRQNTPTNLAHLDAGLGILKIERVF